MTRHHIHAIFISIILTLTFTFASNAQCPGCMVNYSYTNEGLYPDSFDDAVLNQPYDMDVTFVMITDTFGFTINSFTITGIAGLPQGVDWECSNSAGGCIYYPTQNLYGCIKFCGAPTQVGLFSVVVYIDADVQLLGTQHLQFTKNLFVAPPGGANASFSFTPASGCGAATVQYQALINGAPNPTEWQWDFDNGNTGTQQTPPAQFYSAPGTYVPSLTTTVYNFALTSVDLYSCNQNWCGDVEEPFTTYCTGVPDPFFQITDALGNGVYTVGYLNDVSSAGWPINNALLSNPPYTITFVDYDAYTHNDTLGVFPFNPTQTGVINFNSGDGTVASVTIDEVVSSSFFNADTIHVYANPQPPVISLSGSDTICDGQLEALSCDGTFGNSSQWYQDNVAIPGATDSTFTASSSGNYFVTVTSQYGCSAISASLNLFVASSPAVPTIIVNGNDLSSSATGVSFQWMLNGSAISGGTNSSYSITGDGDYSLLVTNSFGCSSSSVVLSLVYNGINELNATLKNFSIHPNPVKDEFTVSFQLPKAGDVELMITDALGRKISEQKFILSSKEFLKTISSKDWTSGIYFLQLISNAGAITQRIVKQ